MSAVIEEETMERYEPTLEHRAAQHATWAMRTQQREYVHEGLSGMPDPLLYPELAREWYAYYERHLGVLRRRQQIKAVLASDGGAAVEALQPLADANRLKYYTTSVKLVDPSRLLTGLDNGRLDDRLEDIAELLGLQDSED